MSSFPQDNHKLKCLLVLKKYEQPPPGYFGNFSSNIITRIEEGDLSEYSSWWQWLVGQYNAKPVLACAYGVAVSALLMGGFTLARIFETESNEAAVPHPWLASTPAASGSSFGSSLFVTRETSEQPFFGGIQHSQLFDHPANSFVPALRPVAAEHFLPPASWVQPASFSPAR